VFRDASIDTGPAATVLELIELNLAPAVVGSATAVRRFLAAGDGGAIVNVSSHQARRAVPGALPYATAKAAVEGLTRALAVDYGPRGVRANAVALGSIDTGRYQDLLAGLEPEAAGRVRDEMASLHPVGRVGRPEEVAAVVAHLLSEEASFVNAPPSRSTAAARSWPATRRPGGRPSGGRGGPGSSGGRPRPARSCRRRTAR
jgi:NAD(P)-dependent dehydrogenase (short-subunit alcohol dehydrogenase family)